MERHFMDFSNQFIGEESLLEDLYQRESLPENLPKENLPKENLPKRTSVTILKGAFKFLNFPVPPPQIDHRELAALIRNRAG